MDSLGHRNNTFAQTADRHSQLSAHTPLAVPETPQSVGKDFSSIYLQTPRLLPSTFTTPSELTHAGAPATPFIEKNTQLAKLPLEQSDLMRKHAEVVRLLRTNSTGDQSSRSPGSSLATQRHLGFTPALTLATQLEGSSRSAHLLADARAVGMKESDLPAYRNLLQLLASMTGRHPSQPDWTAFVLIPFRRKRWPISTCRILLSSCSGSLLPLRLFLVGAKKAPELRLSGLPRKAI
jgi:hypothetical protein